MALENEYAREIANRFDSLVEQNNDSLAIKMVEDVLGQKDLAETDKMHIEFKLGAYYMDYYGMYEESLPYLLEAQELGLKYKDTTLILGAYGQLASLHWYYYSSLDSFQHYIKNMTELGRISGKYEFQGKGLYNNARALQALEQNEEALELLFEAIKVYEKVDDCLMKSMTYENISFILAEEDRVDEGFEYLFKAYDIADTCHEVLAKGLVMGSLGVFYMNTDRVDTAYDIFHKALNIVNELEYLDGQSVVVGNLGECLERLGELDSAIHYYHWSMHFDTIYHNEEGLAFSNITLARIYNKKQDPDMAIMFSQRAEQQAKNLGVPDLVADAYAQMSEAYKMKGDYGKALNYLERQKTISDSLFTIEKKESLNELATKYETEKKEKKIEDLEQEKELERLKSRQWQILGLAAIGVLLSLSLLGYILFTRYRAKKELAAAQQKIAHERQLFDSEMKAIRAQMNPHFMFNALNSIQEFIVLNDKKAAIRHLSEFAMLMRQVLQQSGKQFISLEDELKTLKAYINLENLRLENEIEVDLAIDHKLDTDYIMIPPMLVQPFVENAIKHGLFNKAGLKKLTLKFEAEGRSNLKVTVDDNGVGLGKTGNQQQHSENGHQSFSTAANQTRLRLLNEKRDKKIGLEIIDKSNNGLQETGTRVILNIPYEEEA